MPAGRQSTGTHNNSLGWSLRKKNEKTFRTEKEIFRGRRHLMFIQVCSLRLSSLFFFAFSQLFWGVFTWIYGAGWCYLCVGVKWGQWIDVTQLSPIKLRSPLGWNIWLKETLSHFYTILSSPQVFEKKKKVWLRSKPRGSGIIAHLSSSLNSPVQSRLSCHVQNFLCVQ